MTITYFPFDGVNVFEAQWSEMARLWLSTGVLNTGRSNVDLNKFEVYGDNSGLQVKVKSGTAWIEGFYVKSDAEEIVTLNTADATNPRIDRIILKLDRGANTITLTKLTGTPAGSPSAPALTQNSTIWEISLAQVYVAATDTLIAAGDVTDERTYTSADSNASSIFYTPAVLAHWNNSADPGNLDDALDQLAARRAIVQELYYQDSTLDTHSGTTIPLDNTKPQSNEGKEFLSPPNFTPTDADNILLFEITLVLQHSVNAYLTLALFKNSDTDALYATTEFSATGVVTLRGAFEMVAGTTSPITFKVRGGGSAAGTTTRNGNASAGIFNGICYSSIRIKEIKV